MAHEISTLGRREHLAYPRSLLRPTVAASALALGSLLAASPATAAMCQFESISQINQDAGVEPQLLIDGDCIDPDYNESTFVIDKTEQLAFQVPDGALIPYTQVTGHFPATRTLDTLPPGVRQSPTTFQQKYVFRFPAKEFWRNRSFEKQHPTGGGVVDNEMAFTNGAFSVNWLSNSIPNAVASHRHEAAATKVAKAYANSLYGNSDKIYSYFWGCSGGGSVAMAAAENTIGVWDGIQAQCIGTSIDAQYHSFYWQAHYTMAIEQAKRDAIAAAAVPGGTGEIYTGLNEEQKSVLDEFLSAGYPLAIIGRHFNQLTPLIDPIDIRLGDPTYEDDFWSRPGYAGTSPPDYLKAAKVDGWATITGISRDAAGVPTAVQFDPATIPALGTTGDNYLEYWVYTDDGNTRLIDPTRTFGPPTQNKARFSLIGKLDTAVGTLALTGTLPALMGPPLPITNSPVLLKALKVGSQIRINNRFILAMYYYPRHSIVPGIKSHDQYRNADGSPKYPQRADLSALLHSSYRTMGGRVETGDINTRIMILEGMADQLSWPIFNVGYAERVRETLGPARAEEMMRFYLHDNGSHAEGAGQPGIFQQSIQDMMAWVEQGVSPPPSTRYTVRNGQVILPDNAADRLGLQPVIKLKANGGDRAVVGVNQPVSLVAKLEMPPETGQIVQYSWTVAGDAEAVAVIDKPRETGEVARYSMVIGAADDAVTVLETPLPLVKVNHTITFAKPGTYVVRLNVNGQRDGLLAPGNRTLVQNYRDVRVIVE
jgi:PKD domain